MAAWPTPTASSARPAANFPCDLCAHHPAEWRRNVAMGFLRSESRYYLLRFLIGLLKPRHGMSQTIYFLAPPQTTKAAASPAPRHAAKTVITNKIPPISAEFRFRAPNPR